MLDRRDLGGFIGCQQFFRVEAVLLKEGSCQGRSSTTMILKERLSYEHSTMENKRIDVGIESV